MTLTIGQSLTPEQVRLLPDGAVVRMHKSDRPYLELTVKNGELDIPNCSFNDMQPKGWFALPLATYRWESCILVSPPQPAEPSPGEGYTYGGTGAPAKASLPPESRPASEIEKDAMDAAYFLLDAREKLVCDLASDHKRNPDRLREACELLFKAEHYAKSIGAIE